MISNTGPESRAELRRIWWGIIARSELERPERRAEAARREAQARADRNRLMTDRIRHNRATLIVNTERRSTWQTTTTTGPEPPSVGTSKPCSSVFIR